MKRKIFWGMLLSFFVYSMAALIYTAGGFLNRNGLMWGVTEVVLLAIMSIVVFGALMVEFRMDTLKIYDPPATIGELIFSLFLTTTAGLAFPIIMIFFKSKPVYSSPDDIVFLETFSHNLYNICDKIMIAAVLAAAVCAIIEYKEEN